VLCLESYCSPSGEEGVAGRGVAVGVGLIVGVYAFFTGKDVAKPIAFVHSKMKVGAGVSEAGGLVWGS